MLFSFDLSFDLSLEALLNKNARGGGVISMRVVLPIGACHPMTPNNAKQRW